jgi:deoxyribodipyrimidine photo-lyase
MDVPSQGTSVVWFRRDLRLADHPALERARRRGPVVCLFVVDPAILGRRHHRAPERLKFLRAGLEELGSRLRERGVPLVIREGHPADAVPRVCTEAGADLVVTGAEVSPLGRARDRRVAENLGDAGIAIELHGGDLLAEPEDVPGPAGDGYKVFTPFHRVWREIAPPPHLPAPGSLSGPELRCDGLGALPDGAPLLPAGPAAARERMVSYIRSGAADAYGGRRNDVAADATSGLSPYLRFGMCTGPQIGRALGLPGVIEGGRAELWRQVAWREFFHHLLARHPHAARTAWREDLRGVRWNDDERAFGAWQTGRTGYPLVDAAMRQLAIEGRMHNRTRMVAASFLVKDLLIDWRRGETVFMQRLLDGDPANNNGGWQWVAGTGADAAPYFRVMNPVLQSKKFDADGAYIRRHVPELARVPAPLIHEPWRMTAAEQEAAACVIGRDYPAPIVDHADRRAEALERYAAARGQGREER